MLFFRPYDQQRRKCLAEIVCDSGYQRVFIADHKHVNGFFGHKFPYSREIERRQCHISAISAGASIAGRNKELVYERALCYFPGESRFAAARAKKKEVHG